MAEAAERKDPSVREMETEQTGRYSRLEKRFQGLRAHHDKCLAKHMEYMEHQHTQESSSGSTDPCLPESSAGGTSDDMDVPPLTRSDSVLLTKEYLKQTSGKSDSETSISCVESSGDEYIPAKESADESSEAPSPFKLPLPKDRKFKKTHRRRTESRSSVHEDKETGCEENDTGQDNVTVMRLKKKSDGARVYSKTHYCLYCPISCHKMSRHLVRKHSSELAVATAISFPLKSKERKLHFDLIRNKGNRMHNNEVLKNDSGVLVPSQQTAEPVSKSEYMHCMNCEALLKRKSLWRHISRCRLSQKCSTPKPGRSRIQSLCAFAQPVPESISRKVWELVSAMHQDEVTSIVSKERCIMKLAEHLYTKHGHDKAKHEYIRQKMREVGRLIQQSQRMGKLKCIKDFFVPSNFNHVIEAVKAVAGFNEDTNTYKTPSLALKLGHSLKKIADILECEAQMAESDNEEFLNNLKKTRTLLDKKWDVCVSSGALQTLRESKWNTPQLLPFTEDVKTMHRHLEKCREEYQEHLKNSPNKKNWTRLATVTLAEVILFNRRREGEVSKMPLSAFTLRDTSRVHSDVALGLSKLEQKLCKHFQRIEIRGKRNRKVPVLLTPDMLSSMEVLVEHRRLCGVPDDNSYFFARCEANTHLRGCDAIRRVAKECGAKHPDTLSSTKLRKQVSTLSTVLNLKDNEMDTLANFLGHDIRVHRQYYRLPEGTVELAKVSKVLIALEQGRLPDFTGKSLDEIQIDPNEQVCEAEDSDLSETERETPFFSSAESSSSKGRCQPESDSDDDLTEGPSGPGKRRQPESQTDDYGEGPSGSKKRRQPESHTDDYEGGPSGSKKRRPPESHNDPQIETSKKRSWTLAEVRAVEKTLKPFIECGKVPGKSECTACLKASPDALKARSWTAVKFYVKNRITALKRQSAKRVY